jgi:hypothetical protein
MGQKKLPNSDEYQKRFEIDFTQCPDVQFTRIEELVLARHSGIHTEVPNTFNSYVKKVKNPRFIDDDGRFSVDLTSYQTAVEDVKKFMKWVVYSELKRAAEKFGIEEPE